MRVFRVLFTRQPVTAHVAVWYWYSSTTVMLCVHADVPAGGI
jgi:hypothetical protein